MFGSALRPNQKGAKDGCADGSWDPAGDPWGVHGGRVYATAIHMLTLEFQLRDERGRATSGPPAASGK